MVVGKLASGKKCGYQSQSNWETGSVSKSSLYIPYKAGKKIPTAKLLVTPQWY